MKLHAKLISVLVPLVAAPIAILGWVAYSQQKDSVEANSVRQLDTLVAQISLNIDSLLETARADVILLDSSRLLSRYLLVESESERYRLLQPALLNLFTSYQKANPKYYEIRVLLPDGYEDTRAASSLLSNTTEEEGQTEYFKTMSQSKDNITTQIIQDIDTGKPAALISHRIALVDMAVDPIIAKPNLRGYLVLSMSLDFLHKHVAEAKLGYGGNVFFADKAGRILISASQLEHDVTQNTISPTDNRSGAVTKPLNTAQHMSDAFVIRKRQLHENLFIYAAIPKTVVLASTRRIALISLAIILGSIALTTFLLYGFLRSLLLSPLARIEQAAREVGTGDLVTNIGINRDDEIGHLATSFEDMSKKLHLSHKQISHLAHHDSLTGLPNRHMFTVELERAIKHARQHNEILGLLFLDLDDFKRVNDSLGHQAGDMLLRKIAERLASVVRPEDCLARQESQEGHSAVARLGGDEFIVMLPGLVNTMNAGSVARRTLDTLSHPLVIDGHELEISASIGITVFPDDGQTTDELIKCADIAMYHAKEQGKNHFQYYTRELNIALLQHIEMEKDLRKAIAKNELLLNYQPQVDAGSGEIVGIEALVRWNSPVRGLVSPGDFIPLAEETGLIRPLGEWVLNEACRQNRSWQAAGLKSVPIAINVSGRQFTGKGLEESVRNALAKSGLEPQYLDIEITETCVMERPEEAADILNALKSLGIQISLDDFGTGYSSLAILKRMPIDLLKIDQSFVRDITTDHSDAAITSAIIAMGHNLGLKVIAEGVEQLEQLHFLRNHACDRIQGYLISRPLSADNLAKLLASAPLPLHQIKTDTLQTHQQQKRPNLMVISPPGL